jgi:hypothetical protein
MEFAHTANVVLATLLLLVTASLVALRGLQMREGRRTIEVAAPTLRWALLALAAGAFVSALGWGIEEFDIGQAAFVTGVLRGVALVLLLGRLWHEVVEDGGKDERW